MPGMKLLADAELRAKRATFGAKVQDGELRLPPEVYRLAKGWKAETAEDFYAKVSYLPGITGAAFGWTREDSLKAIAELAELLRGNVPEAVLVPASAAVNAAAFAPAPDYAEVFGEIASPSGQTDQPVAEEPKVIVDGMPPVDGFEE